MTDILAFLILALLLGLAVSYLIKARRKGGKCIGCPAGGSCPAMKKGKKKKLEGPVVGQKILKISGMHCPHCAMGVTRALERIEGVCAETDLSAGRAKVSCDREISDEVLRAAVEACGCQVVSIS